MWGEWIEMGYDVGVKPELQMSLPVWGEWIEMLFLVYWIQQLWSLPVWGEWIEIQ